jgi:hypothetical protein
MTQREHYMPQNDESIKADPASVVIVSAGHTTTPDPFGRHGRDIAWSGVLFLLTEEAFTAIRIGDQLHMIRTNHSEVGHA